MVTTSSSAVPGVGQALFLEEPGDAQLVSVTDIAQGYFGDCFFLASLGEIAFRDPAYISHVLISSEPDGTENVRLFDNGQGQPIKSYDQTLTSSFSPTTVNVSNVFSPNAVNTANTNDIVNNVKEIWPEVAEKAYDTYTSGGSENGGFDVAAMEALTGHRAYYQPTSEVTFRELNHLNHAGALMTFDTPSSGDLPYNLINDHAYMFAGFENQGGQTDVKLLNPWGDNQPDLIPFSKLASVLPQFNHAAI